MSSKKEIPPSDWKKYAENTVGPDPRRTVTIALENFISAGDSNGVALDLGCGAGNDALFLAQRGWEVVAIDSNRDALELLRSRLTPETSARVTSHEASVADLKLPVAKLIVASFSLPFVGQETLLPTWDAVRAALLPGGRFAGHFFGTEEPLVKEGKAASVDRATLGAMFRGLEIEYFDEELSHGPTADGSAKDWHVYSVVAKRSSAAEGVPGAHPTPLPLLYHCVPSDLQGTELMPLTMLREHFPAIFERENAKYAGREFVKEQPVHGLDCLWNDVLHFLPFHPAQIRAAFESAGLSWQRREFFEVDPLTAGMRGENTVIFREDPFREPRLLAHADEFTPLSAATLQSCGALPFLTRRYYQAMAQQGKRPLIAHGVPHVLYRGVIPIAATRRVLV